jgi:hypothetical protein
MKKIIVIIVVMMALSGCFAFFPANDTNDPSLFDGLQPKAVFDGYKIYDLVEQRGLPCAEALDYVGMDTQYQYYLSCLRKEQIYLVSSQKTVKMTDAIEDGIITLKQLYELKIISRMKNE